MTKLFFTIVLLAALVFLIFLMGVTMTIGTDSLKEARKERLDKQKRDKK